ncbi:MAG: hypothetical protein U5K00_04175 [Melioribacteraceae bacterium]|nr:hypothetical protein [Melioribacteraceae bacterium]
MSRLVGVYPGVGILGGMGGGMMPNSIFVQMMELFPESIPNAHGQGHFAGYEMGFFFPSGQRGMGNVRRLR